MQRVKKQHIEEPMSINTSHEKKRIGKLNINDLRIQLSQPTLLRASEARLAGCVFHERNTHGVATNVYLRKSSEKTGKDAIYELLSERFGSCIYARGRY